MNELTRVPSDRALPLLLGAMGDQSWRVRKDAVAAILGSQPLEGAAIEGVIDLLRSPDNAGLRSSAVELLERLGPGAVPSLCRHLDDPDHDVRKFLIDILGCIGSGACLPMLIAALDDPDPNVRVAAAENLGKIGDPQALPRLLKILDGGDLWLKFTVLDALSLIGAPVPLEVLEPLLKENLLRRAIYDCLGALGDGRCLPLLMGGLREHARNARESAAVALMRVRSRLEPYLVPELVDRPLGALKGDPELSGLLSSLEGSDPAILDALARLVGLVGDERAVPGLLCAARQERLRGSCLAAFRGIGDAALPQLLQLFPQVHPPERAFIASVVGELGLAGGTPLVLDGLEDDCAELRAACAAALGRIAPPGAAGRLARLLEDPYEEVRDAALESLKRLSSQEPEELARLGAELAVAASPVRRRDAALLLGSLSDHERLTLLAKDEDATVRAAAVSSLARVGTTALGALVMALVDEEPLVRAAAAQSLGEIGGEEVLEPLLISLGDSDTWVQGAALKGLAALGDPRALPGVTALLAQAHGPVLITGLQTLAALGRGEELAPVRRALADPDEEVVQAAIAILAATGGDWIEPHREALLSHPHWGVRRCFARALTELLGAGALPFLEEALVKEADPLVKGELALLVGRLR